MKYPIKVQNNPLAAALKRKPIYVRALKVFGSDFRTFQWFNTPINELGRKKPLDLTLSAEGIRQIDELLTKLYKK